MPLDCATIIVVKTVYNSRLEDAMTTRRGATPGGRPASCGMSVAAVPSQYYVRTAVLCDMCSLVSYHCQECAAASRKHLSHTITGGSRH